jgi:hypothetical protein
VARHIRVEDPGWVDGGQFNQFLAPGCAVDRLEPYRLVQGVAEQIGDGRVIDFL